jgi:hypothetical protein
MIKNGGGANLLAASGVSIKRSRRGIYRIAAKLSRQWRTGV